MLQHYFILFGDYGGKNLNVVIIVQIIRKRVNTNDTFSKQILIRVEPNRINSLKRTANHMHLKMPR